MVDVTLFCATCGTPLTGDPDEDPTGDAGMPICGNCARERDFFVMDMVDGVEDGNWDPEAMNQAETQLSFARPPRDGI